MKESIIKELNRVDEINKDIIKYEDNSINNNIMINNTIKDDLKSNEMKTPVVESTIKDHVTNISSTNTKPINPKLETTWSKMNLSKSRDDILSPMSNASGFEKVNFTISE
jgi:hypothetical protein